MSSEVAAGLSRLMTNQMPTPVMEPSTMVTSRKKRAWRRTWSSMAGLFSRSPLRSASTRKRPPPTAKWAM